MTQQRIDLGVTASTPTAGGCGDGCGCGHSSATPATPASSARPADTELRVEGMTCAHCVRAVTAELDALDGVEVLDIDLHDGGVSIVRIASTGASDAEAIAGAIDEAGYRLAD